VIVADAPSPLREAPRAAPRTVDELETLLSTPDDRVITALELTPGDVIVLGAGGKMGPTLARMLRVAADALGDDRRVIAVSRFRDATAVQRLTSARVETISCDLTDASAVANLPHAPNIIFMAGQKFGTRDDPSVTWAMNAAVPTLVAQQYPASRIMVFSTGNVYPLTKVSHGGSREDDPLKPVGEYAQSCVARERIFTYYAARHDTPLAIMRLNYAIDLRYGVLVDIAARVHAGRAVSLAMGSANVIWQGDANACAIMALSRASTTPFVVNVTGSEIISVRDVATRFGVLFGRPPQLEGREGGDALLSDTALMRRTLGPPGVSLDTMIEWVAAWIRAGGVTLGKPTGFEARDGQF
jgi:nucleoside-diphosphate-sugar epimerase